MTHYQDQRWTAVPSEAVTKAVLDMVDVEAFIRRFNSKVDFGFAADDCHIWLGALSDEGYGNFKVKRHTVRAHRVAYMLAFGAVPDATPFLDHVDCLGRWCVNPAHLEPVTNAENTRRGTGVGIRNQRVTRSEEILRRAALRSSGADEIF